MPDHDTHSPDGPTDPIDCPKCGIRMRQLWLHDVLIDRCETCLGIWLDKGERKRLLENRTLLEMVDVGTSERGAARNVMKDISCPRCKQLMRHVLHKKQRHIGFEYCDLCHGNFFDAGELSDMGEYSVAERIRAFLHLGTDISPEPD